MKYYNLYINFENSVDTYNAVKEIFQIEPQKNTPTKFNQNLFDKWWYQAVQKETDASSDFINFFLDLLEPNFEKLSQLGISKSDIIIWMVYEYDKQCSMEFHPQEMKRLGENGISFNIDCYAIKKEL